MSKLRTQSQVMSGYYAWHSRIYDATRWAFLFDRDAILDDLWLAPGETVVEVGSGTGHNLAGVLRRIGSTGELFAVDCSAPMIERCRRRIQHNAWKNVQLVEREYGDQPVTRGKADVVLLSYSLSMIPTWEKTLECVLAELKPGGRIGVVDFCLDRRNAATSGFARWMAQNHVTLDRSYRENLSSRFPLNRCVTRRAPGGLWSFYRFVGQSG